VTYLFDTNVACEATKTLPDPAVLAWISTLSSAAIFLSAITVAEIRYGIEAAPIGARRAALETWYRTSIGGEAAQVLPVTTAIAEVWGRIRRQTELAKRTMPIMDAFIAATAEVHGLTVVTRNTKDFETWGGPVFDPWTGSPTD
jgi:predicted nucleic acid-binding protein